MPTKLQGNDKMIQRQLTLRWREPSNAYCIIWNSTVRMIHSSLVIVNPTGLAERTHLLYSSTLFQLLEALVWLITSSIDLSWDFSVVVPHLLLKFDSRCFFIALPCNNLTPTPLNNATLFHLSQLLPHRHCLCEPPLSRYASHHGVSLLCSCTCSLFQHMLWIILTNNPRTRSNQT